MNNLTIEEFNHENIKSAISEWSHVGKVELIIFCAELSMDSVEAKYPNDNRPRIAINAAKAWCLSTTEENKQKCKDATDAFAYADADYVFADAADAYATAFAGAFAGTFAGAFAGAATAFAGAYAGAYFHTAEIKQKIINYINDKNNKLSDSRKKECNDYHAGLTKREHFAGLAMQGLLSNSGGPIQASQMIGFSFCNCNDADVAILSVQMADALLAELD